MEKAILPPTYFVIAILLMVLLRFAVPALVVISYPWNLAGGLPLLIGVVLNVVADRAFKAANTTVKPFRKSSALVTSGVFRISRNPMYLGMLFILAGLGIIMGSLTPFIVVPVFAVTMDLIFISTEDNMLGEQFGEQWSTYKQRVRKWL